MCSFYYKMINIHIQEYKKLKFSRKEANQINKSSSFLKGRTMSDGIRTSRKLGRGLISSSKTYISSTAAFS